MQRNPSFEVLSVSVEGEVVLPEDPVYEDTSQIWNSRLQKMPAAIVRCAGTADVAAAVKFARREGLPLSVRSGGHSYAGLGVLEDGLMIDLSPMKETRIDGERKRAFVQPGVRWGEFHETAIREGLGTTGGTVSSVGVAGFTLGGGSGYLSRKYGLALDNLVSAEVVTADGKVVEASETANPDLFWGIRGGAGNLGIVTRFEFRLFEADAEMFAGQIIYPFEVAGKALRIYREVMAKAPDELVCYPCFIHIPPIPAFPEELHGQVVLDFVLSYCGEMSDGERAVGPLRGISEPILEAIGPQPYLEVHRALDAGAPEGQRWYSRAHYLDEIPDAAIETVLGHAKSLPGAFSFVYFEPLGGAISRVDPADTAFPHRNARYSFHILAGWMEPGEDRTVIEWAGAFHEAMAPFASGGVYVNLLSEDETERIPEAYGQNYARLVELKREWDPENLFRGNQNVSPH